MLNTHTLTHILTNKVIMIYEHEELFVINI